MTAATLRTTPLPVRLHADVNQILLHVGARKVASAWGPAADDHDTWFLWNGHTNPYRISGGRDGALSILEDLRDEQQHHEGSLWHPDHGTPDDAGYIATAPAGVVCVGCGTDLGGSTYVGTVGYRTIPATEETSHYICDHCHCYLDDEVDE